jgi:hypothetical protein
MTVVRFPGPTATEIDPKTILSIALDQPLESVMIIGWTTNDEMYASSSGLTLLEAVATIDVCKQSMLNEMTAGDEE